MATAFAITAVGICTADASTELDIEAAAPEDLAIGTVLVQQGLRGIRDDVQTWPVCGRRRIIGSRPDDGNSQPDNEYQKNKSNDIHGSPSTIQGLNADLEALTRT
jgi:hypothetical protein